MTLSGAGADTLRKEESGRLCYDAVLAMYTFTGQYTITGGTGSYQGATGTGSSSFQFGIGILTGTPFTSQEIGTFQVPGVASAASKRTFKMRGTVSAAKLCKGAERNANQPRRCKKLGVLKLR